MTWIRFMEMSHTCGLGSLEAMKANAMPGRREEEETKGLREVGMLEWACCVKSEDLPESTSLPVSRKC